jgi:hypothetical protein
MDEYTLTSDTELMQNAGLALNKILPRASKLQELEIVWTYISPIAVLPTMPASLPALQSLVLNNINARNRNSLRAIVACAPRPRVLVLRNARFTDRKEVSEMLDTVGVMEHMRKLELDNILISALSNRVWLWNSGDHMTTSDHGDTIQLERHVFDFLYKCSSTSLRHECDLIQSSADNFQE